jgi:hypothetical protein
VVISGLGQTAEFAFDKKIHKFEPTREGETLICVFPFTNKGEAPMVISKYEVECTCTVVEYPKEPIQPGQGGEIKVTFDSKGKIGWQFRKVRLYANTKKNPTEVEFRVKILNP